jgi:hypothetical protein
MKIGEPRKVHEIEPVDVPVPEPLPDPTPEPIREPAPAQPVHTS